MKDILIGEMKVLFSHFCQKNISILLQIKEKYL